MADLRKLKHDALDAAGKGNWRKAATCYANLEKDEPRDPVWALKLGECLRRLGNDAEAVKAFARAAAGYAKSDLLLKAIALCKIIISIDPNHTQTQEMLASLCAAQKQPAATAAPLSRRTPTPPTAPPAFPSPLEMHAGTGTGAEAEAGDRVPASGPRAPAADTGSGPGVRPPAPGAACSPPPLPRLRLSALVPGSHQSAQLPASGSSAAMEIPVGDEFASAPAMATRPHKSAGRETMATFVLPKTPFFAVLTAPLLRMAIQRVRLIGLAAGEVLFSKGDAGDDLFVVAWGEMAVLVPQEVARLSEGDFFGEIALLADQPRTATVRATVDSQVLAFDRALISDLVTASPQLLGVLLRFLRERLVATLAETSALFGPFTALERLALAARFQLLEVDEGLRMVEEAGKSAGLFVLLAGEAHATVGGQVVGRLGPGEVFGEISLISGRPCNASMTAACKSFVLFLPRADFNEVIMTHPQVLEYLSTLVEVRAIRRVDLL